MEVLVRHVALALMTLLASPAMAQDPLGQEERKQFMGPFAPLAFSDAPVVVGLVRVVTPPSTAMPVHLAALDARTLEERWRIGGVGDALIDLVQRFTHLGRFGDTVLIAQANRQVRGLSVDDGSVRWTVPLSDVPTALCVLDGNVFVDVLDQKRVRIDPESGSSEAIAEMPSGCVTDGTVGAVDATGRPTAVLTRTEGRDDQLVAGLERDAIVGLRGSEGGVALLHKAPGTSVPYVAGWNGSKLTWRRALDIADRFAAKPEPPEVLAMTDTVAVIAYRRRMGEARVQAIELTTGRALWDVAPPHPEHEVQTLRIAGDHVLVGHWTFLESLDLRTGEATGSYGIW